VHPLIKTAELRREKSTQNREKCKSKQLLWVLCEERSGSELRSMTL